MLDDDTHRHRLEAVLRAVGSSDDQAERPLGGSGTWLGSSARTVASLDLAEAPPSLYTRFGTDLAQAWSAHLAAEHFAFGLAHGDLAPRNLIARGPGRAPVLIDWGAAETGPSPWTDARRVCLERIERASRE